MPLPEDAFPTREQINVQPKVHVSGQYVVNQNGTLVLQLGLDLPSQNHTKWVDWLTIKRAHRTNKQGVFAARTFPRRAIVGFYVGPTTWTADKVGTRKPSDDNLPDDYTPSAMWIMDFHGRWTLRDPPKPDRDIPHAPLYMAMHLINDDRDNDPNCNILDDGAVQTTKTIRAGQELFCQPTPVIPSIDRE